MIQIVRIVLSTVFTLGAANVALSHEFWIEPLKYQIGADEKIEARFRNGEQFDGTELAFFDRRSAQLQIAFGDRRKDVTPRNGDRPAIAVEPIGSGLHVILHETQPSSLTYKEWAKFEKFAAHKDFPDIKARHAARGLPESDFKEQYSRHAKTLIAVAGYEGQDRRFGLETEIVALSNPYDPNFNNNFKIEVYNAETKRADAQVEIFEKAPDGTVMVSLIRTNGQGLAEFPTRPGHSYLLDAVILRPTANGAEYAWETYWAALTFMVPE